MGLGSFIVQKGFIMLKIINVLKNYNVKIFNIDYEIEKRFLYSGFKKKGFKVKILYELFML